MIDKINYAIEKIGQRTLFDIDYPLMDSLDLALQRRPSMTTGWINEFSNLGLELLKENSLLASLANRERKDSVQYSDKISTLSEAPSLSTLMQVIDSQQDNLQMINSIDFDTLKFCTETGRKSGLSAITLHIMTQLKLDSSNLNRQKLSKFLGVIYKGYRRDVEYHNDMHAADVLQMSYVFLTQGEILQFASLSELDLISIVISAVCHDYGHDGMNNAYHVNTISDRAIRYSDQSVQENFHAAESFTILNSNETNFLEEFSRDDFKTFRQRFIGIILATDMARHASDLNNMKTLLEQKGISDGQNQSQVIDRSSTKLEFNSKQTLLEFVVHSADVSTQTRTFDIAVQWTQLLFEEFFHQGDMEKEQGLPVSFLCDRDTTQIPSSQPSFVNFILLPLFSIVSQLMPNVKQLEENARRNAENWKTYEETERFK